MPPLVVNCLQLPFSTTLGVASVVLGVCEQLAADRSLVFVAADVDEVDSSPAGPRIRAMATDVITPTRVTPELRRQGIELVPHHFQRPTWCVRSIIICHDLHVFDIPWKYGDRSGVMQENFRRNLLQASAVMTHFPRTYYAIEQVAGIRLPALFLTESPLMLDTTKARSGPRPDDDLPSLLYPAQLQAHKNHVVLAEMLRRLRASGREVALRLPGSEFAGGTTAEIRAAFVDAGVDDLVEFLGRVSDQRLIELYGQSDGVIVPSAAEGGAYVGLEAIAAGKPVAINDIDSARMHVAALQAEVIWFDARDADDVERAALELLDADSNDWRRRNDRCRSRLSTTGWPAVAARWRDVIAWLDGARPKPVLRVDRTCTELHYT